MNNSYRPKFTGTQIKSIVLKTPEECFQANKIINQLVESGCQILPQALYPNEIRITYIESEKSTEFIGSTANTNYNMICVKSGNSGLAYSTS